MQKPKPQRLSALLGRTPDEADNDPLVSGLAIDHRKIKDGDIFVAIKGEKTDGHDFAAAAIEAGARAVVHQQPLSEQAVKVAEKAKAVLCEVNDSRFAASELASRYFLPKPATIVAITGTNGKTSVASFLRQIWTLNNIPAAAVGTLGVEGAELNDNSSLTTPDVITLHRILFELKCQNIDHAVFEASSHGLDQFRLHHINIAAAAFTNLTQDHLDYHENMEAYYQAKKRLFTEILPIEAPAIVNADDLYGQRLIDELQALGKKNIKTVGKLGSTLKLIDIDDTTLPMNVKFAWQKDALELSLGLPGAFQAENTLISAALAEQTGLGKQEIMSAMHNLVAVRGRLEMIANNKEGAPVFVDFAHTPDSLEKTLLTLRKITKNDLVVVFGCGGDRDRGKRPIMGEIANRLADHVIITDDNPRTEDANSIREEIRVAVPRAQVIGDRKSAIAAAIEMASAKDVVVIAGKGHETGQIFGIKVRPFSDQEAILKLIKLSFERA